MNIHHDLNPAPLENLFICSNIEYRNIFLYYVYFRIIKYVQRLHTHNLFVLGNIAVDFGKLRMILVDLLIWI